MSHMAWNFVFGSNKKVVIVQSVLKVLS